MAALSLRNLCKSYEGPRGSTCGAVSNLNLELRHGEFLVLVGPVGSGKTTLLRMIAGLESPTAGEIHLGDRPIHHLEPRQRDVAMVFQQPALFPHLTVYQNLALGLQLRKTARREVRDRVEEVASRLHLTELLDRMPQTLSGGQSQRVCLGRALLRRPQLFLFDEPFAHLDPLARRQLHAELQSLHTRLDATMIYVTHEQDEAMWQGQRIAVLRDGCMQQVAVPGELYHRPINRFVAEFIGAPPINCLTGLVANRENGLRFEFESEGRVAWTLEIPRPPDFLTRQVGSRVILGLRPIDIDARPQPSSPATEASLLIRLDRRLTVESMTWGHFRIGNQRIVAKLTRQDFDGDSDIAWELTADPGLAHWFSPTSGDSLR